VNTIEVHARAIPDIPESVLEQYENLPTAAVSDCVNRDPGAGGLIPIAGFSAGVPRAAMVGRALTVRTRPGDNLALHYALEVAGPRDVIVIDGGGDLRNALLGELIVAYATRKGVAGLVVDGAVRDRSALQMQELPVFARGVTHRGPYKSGPGQIHSSISVGGSVVTDGDLVMGDLDGIVFVPRQRVSEIAAAAEAVVRSEEQQYAQIMAGTWDRSWIAATTNIVNRSNAAQVDAPQENGATNA
jgi:regulator of RNase E activity RraA